MRREAEVLIDARQAFELKASQEEQKGRDEMAAEDQLQDPDELIRRELFKSQDLDAASKRWIAEHKREGLDLDAMLERVILFLEEVRTTTPPIPSPRPRP